MLVRHRLVPPLSAGDAREADVRLVGGQFAGNLFFSPGLAEAIGTGIAGALVGGFATLPSLTLVSILHPEVFCRATFRRKIAAQLIGMNNRG